MTALPAQELNISKQFDLETYMILSGNRRLDGQKAQELENTWQRTAKFLHAYRLGEEEGYLLLYLDENFDQEFQKALQKSPDRAEELQILAQTVILSAMLELIPGADPSSCAPVPRPNQTIKDSLEPLGLKYKNNAQLSVQFGLITELPFHNDCERCFIKNSCAKRITQGSE